MLRMAIRLVLGVALLAGWTTAALAVHVVRTPTQIVLLTKDKLDFRDTWADTRRWTPEDLKNHPVLVARLLSAGRTDLLSHVLKARNDDDLRRQIADNADQTPPQNTQLSAGPVSFTLPF
jgi:hypothetical protein